MKITLLLLLLIACGKEEKESKKKLQEEFDEDGLFYGSVEPFNKAKASGHIKISKMGDSLQVTVKFKGSSNTYEQYLFESSDCPRTDMDGDGTIDASEVGAQAGGKLMALNQGIQETSYHLMLADLGRDVIKFDERTFIVYNETQPIGCATIDRVFEEPIPEPEEEPNRPRRPRPRPRPEPEVKPPPPPPPGPDNSSWWSRLSDRLRQWWCRVRRRCG